jgi:hypothetical protein
MTIITCSNCGRAWDASFTPCCPQCQSTNWQNAPTMIRPKHDPSLLPSGSTSYRSVLTPELVANVSQFFDYAATSGTWCFSSRHQAFCHVTFAPLNAHPGSGVNANDPMPSHAHDCLVIAQANTPKAHAYTADWTGLVQELQNGTLKLLPKCVEIGCGNLASPGNDRCAKHSGLAS